jgi:hypothetical protein
MLIGAEDLVRLDPLTARITASAATRITRSVLVAIAGTPCAVHFEDDAASRCFAARYADLAAPAGTVLHEAFAVCDPVLGPLFWSRGGTVFRWPHGPLSAEVVAFLADAVAITAFFNDRTDGLVSLHAAAVGMNGHVAAILGDSNVGKTTTAIACGRIGMQLYSDERCVIDRGSLVHPFPRAVNVREPGRQLLLRDRVPGRDPLGMRLRTHGEGAWSDVRFNELFDHWTRPPAAPLRAVFVLAGVATQPGLEAASAIVAAKAAARWALGAGAGMDKIARLLEILRDASCYRLILGSPDASARAIARALAPTQPQRVSA